MRLRPEPRPLRYAWRPSASTETILRAVGGDGLDKEGRGPRRQKAGRGGRGGRSGEGDRPRLRGARGETREGRSSLVCPPPPIYPSTANGLLSDARVRDRFGPSHF